MTKFTPIERTVCSGCGRPEPGYYDQRKEHMAVSFRSGVPVQTIAAAYGVSPDWCMNLIREQLGHEAVVEVISVYRIRSCEMCGTPIEPEQESDWVNGIEVHAACLLEVADV